MRWPNGFQCPRCAHERAYKIRTRKFPLYECCQCNYQTTVLVGTIFEKTRTDLRKWFWAIYLVAHDKRGVSARLIADEVGVRYVTAWTMLHKIRNAMERRDSSYQLGGIVELDDSFFGGPTSGNKRGRGTEKSKVLVGLSLDDQGRPLHLKMETIDDLKSETIFDFAERNLELGASITSDLYQSYKVLAKGYNHEPKKFDLIENPNHLKWLHVVVSNAKTFINGTYHGLGKKHLQSYLAEYCYRFNRRIFKGELFNRLINCCLNTKTVTYPELIG